MRGPFDDEWPHPYLVVAASRDVARIERALFEHRHSAVTAIVESPFYIDSPTLDTGTASNWLSLDVTSNIGFIDLPLVIVARKTQGWTDAQAEGPLRSVPRFVGWIESRGVLARRLPARRRV